ncbi:condensin complex subunit 2 [Anaeramoeba flamelloides]|uniref:Condensin complex subunit 2 n=1 Tax=Anaeramoeba flamelloides TaxID=1746091 RepID=A0ABQ8YIA6_9EUKA|nr:condensin complex subunit 2 [Anaeramoeba flamelloides]
MNKKKKNFKSRRQFLLDISKKLDNNSINQMYDACIKICTDKRLTKKNAWSLNLIDHMSEVIQSKAKEKNKKGSETDFTVACFTIDAGAKLYGIRVDSVLGEVYKMVSDLNRSTNSNNNKSNKDQSSQGNNEDQKTENEIMKRKWDQGGNSTLEKDFVSLELKNFKDFFGSDPLFRNLGIFFANQGNSKILLLNVNAQRGSELVFDPSDPEIGSELSLNYSLLNLKNLIKAGSHENENENENEKEQDQQENNNTEENEKEAEIEIEIEKEKEEEKGKEETLNQKTTYKQTIPFTLIENEFQNINVSDQICPYFLNFSKENWNEYHELHPSFFQDNNPEKLNKEYDDLSNIQKQIENEEEEDDDDDDEEDDEDNIDQDPMLDFGMGDPTLELGENEISELMFPSIQNEGNENFGEHGDNDNNGRNSKKQDQRRNSLVNNTRYLDSSVMHLESLISKFPIQNQQFEYSYFDSQNLNKNLTGISSFGSKLWEFGNRKIFNKEDRNSNDSVTSEIQNLSKIIGIGSPSKRTSNQNNNNTKKKKKKSKKELRINFNAKNVTSKELGTSDSTRSYQMSKNELEKHNFEETTLPEDLNYNVYKFTQLFTKSNLQFAMFKTKNQFKKRNQQDEEFDSGWVDSVGFDFDDNNDIQIENEQVPFAPQIQILNQQNDDNSVNDLNDDLGLGIDTNSNLSINQLTSKFHKMNIQNENQSLQAKKLKFMRAAKKIPVSELKVKIKDILVPKDKNETLEENQNENENENEKDKKSEKEVEKEKDAEEEKENIPIQQNSFKNILSKLSKTIPKEKRSVHLSFISLLHLANEMELSLFRENSNVDKIQEFNHDIIVSSLKKEN